MQAAKLEAIPLYPEERPCPAPSARRVLDLFQPVQRHTLTAAGRSETFSSELTDVQRQILQLLRIPNERYALWAAPRQPPTFAKKPADLLRKVSANG